MPTLVQSPRFAHAEGGPESPSVPAFMTCTPTRANLALALVVFATLLVAAPSRTGANARTPPDPETVATTPVGTLTHAPLTLTSELGETLELEAGYLHVPERRDVRDSRTIALYYHRIPSTSADPGPAIFLLAGGPGSSWIETLAGDERFRELQLYRELGDVVVFDQRGSGASVPGLDCDERRWIPLDEPLTRATVRTAVRGVSEACRDHWMAEGVEFAGYTTDENAADVDALRRALGYERIILVGGSYGSHLGLHVMRRYPEHVDRALLYGIEGPDHTWDLPTHALATLERIAADAEKAPYFAGKIPEGGLIRTLHDAIERVRREPITVEVALDDTTLEAHVGELAMTTIASHRAGKRSRPEVWPELILALHAGDYSLPARAALGYHRVDAPGAMGAAMDAASGASEARRRRIAVDPARRIVGDPNLVETMTEDVWPVPEPGEAFHAGVVSDVPALLVHGTWDTSTPIENAREVVAHLSEGHLIEVVGGTHGALYNLYEHWPPMRDLVRAFLRGETIDPPDHVDLGPADYPEPVGDAQAMLWDAAITGDLDAARAAIRAGADVNALDTRRSRSGRRPLNWAAQHGHVAMIELLLDEGADLHGTNLTGFTAFHHAAEEGKLDAARALLARGADPTIPSRAGALPIDTARRFGHDDVVALLDGR